MTTKITVEDIQRKSELAMVARNRMKVRFDLMMAFDAFFFREGAAISLAERRGAMEVFESLSARLSMAQNEYDRAMADLKAACEAHSAQYAPKGDE